VIIFYFINFSLGIILLSFDVIILLSFYVINFRFVIFSMDVTIFVIVNDIICYIVIFVKIL
jgi:hypothetical protein